MNQTSIRHFISMREEKGMSFTRFRDAIILNLEFYIQSNQIQRQNKDIFGNLRTKKTEFPSIFISYFYCEKLSQKSKMGFNELKLRCWQNYISFGSSKEESISLPSLPSKHCLNSLTPSIFIIIIRCTQYLQQISQFLKEMQGTTATLYSP